MTKIKYVGEKGGLTVMPSLIQGERGRDLSFKKGVPKEVEDVEANYLLANHEKDFEVVTDSPAPVEEVVETPAEEISVEEPIVEVPVETEEEKVE